MSQNPLRVAFDEFVAAQEVQSTLDTFNDLIAKLLESIPEETRTNPDELFGLERFETLLAQLGPTLPFRQGRVFEQLSAEVNKRKALVAAREEGRGLKHTPIEKRTKVLVSGGGPCGLRAAVENVMLGMDVTLIEKRSNFSRVNILLLWGVTAEDLFALCAKCFYTEWRIGVTTHMGTREIQLTLLKSALLLGVKVKYRHAIVGVFATSDRWNAVIQTKPPKKKKESFVKRASRRLSGALDLNKKSNKGASDYRMTYHCNAVDNPEVNEKFVQAANMLESPNTSSVEFDALVVAEGEWSNTCRSLGFAKTVDKFSQAIGLVINMTFDKTCKAEKDAREFTLTKLNGSWKSSLLNELAEDGLNCEIVEYLRGTTHYFVVTIGKESLLAYGVLKNDLPSTDLLDQSNLDVDKLFSAARIIVTKSGLPETAEFFPQNPVQIFDFSSRARARQSVKVLVAPGSTSPPRVMDTLDVMENGDEQITRGSVCAPVFPVGDALLEPFWPQGLGTNRGFHGALDAAFAILCHDQEGRDANGSTISKEQLLKCMYEREFAYSAMNVVTWTPTGVLNPFKKWSTDPIDRYHGNLIETARVLASQTGQPLPPRVEALPCQGLSMISPEAPGVRDWTLGRDITARDSEFVGLKPPNKQRWSLQRPAAKTGDIVDEVNAKMNVPRFRAGTASIIAAVAKEMQPKSSEVDAVVEEEKPEMVDQPDSPPVVVKPAEPEVVVSNESEVAEPQVPVVDEPKQLAPVEPEEPEVAEPEIAEPEVAEPVIAEPEVAEPEEPEITVQNEQETVTVPDTEGTATPVTVPKPATKAVKAKSRPKYISRFPAATASILASVKKEMSAAQQSEENTVAI